jgi:hypothetical protein
MEKLNPMRSTPSYVAGPQSSEKFRGVPHGFFPSGNVIPHSVSNFLGGVFGLVL